MHRKNRQLRGAEFWRGIFEQWRRSGMAQRTFCVEKGLNYYAFYYWYRKLVLNNVTEKKSAEGKQLRMPLAEVVVVESEHKGFPKSVAVGQEDIGKTAWYEISLPRGRRIRVGADFEEAFLVHLVRALESC